MAKNKTVYVCDNCGEESITWQGKCPVCGAWNSFKELKIAAPSPGGRGTAKASSVTPMERLDVAKALQTTMRSTSSIPEFDRVLGGGMVAGSVVLLGGEPGVGKSTLLLQVAQALSDHKTVAYFSGEESVHQVADRAKRLGMTPNFLFTNETRIDEILGQVVAVRPDLIIIDSIQTLYDEAFPSTPGSLVQVRECALRLQSLAKKEGVAVILVGHITKEGTVAGPKTLEHMVDVVMYLEGDPRSDIRLLRSVKNRFGATHEVGLFTLGEAGMASVENPALLFTEAHRESIAGTALTAVVEGVRPILVEVQALVVTSSFGYPKRTSLGLDGQHLSIILAVLESRTGVRLSQSDVFVNVVGGYRLHDRGADLAICLAILSAACGQPLPSKQVFYGEVGLSGEVRKVQHHGRRDSEVSRLGFEISPTGGKLRDIAQTFDLLRQKGKKGQDA